MTDVPKFASIHPKILIFQMEQVKQDLSRKDTELLGLQTKLETLTNQFSDSKQHIEVLKESLTAKEQRAAILQTEVQDLGPSAPTQGGTFGVVLLPGCLSF